jgi:hypothetical protein
MLCTFGIIHYLDFCPLFVIKIKIKTKLFRDRISSHPHPEEYSKYSKPLANSPLLLKVGTNSVPKTLGVKFYFKSGMMDKNQIVGSSKKLSLIM